MAHTPGPWKSITEGAETYIKGERYWICEIISIDNEEELDNARLIAAAPEMLEALKAIMEWDISDLVELRAIKAEKIAPAIAKAEGQP